MPGHALPRLRAPSPDSNDRDSAHIGHDRGAIDSTTSPSGFAGSPTGCWRSARERMCRRSLIPRPRFLVAGSSSRVDTVWQTGLDHSRGSEPDEHKQSRLWDILSVSNRNECRKGVRTPSEGTLVPQTRNERTDFPVDIGKSGIRLSRGTPACAGAPRRVWYCLANTEQPKRLRPGLGRAIWVEEIRSAALAP